MSGTAMGREGDIFSAGSLLRHPVSQPFILPKHPIIHSKLCLSKIILAADRSLKLIKFIFL